MKIARLALLAALWASGAPAQMYKCVDARGVTHYSDKPTPGCANAKVDIQASPPISGRLAPAEDAAQQEADFRRRRIERGKAERDQRAARAELESRCTGLRRQRAQLSSGRRLAELNAQGEPVFMDDATRERRLASVEAALRQCR